ncbi:MAG: hypothetical protein RIF46_11570 [Cyclobacteriaceae bacterium]
MNVWLVATVIGSLRAFLAVLSDLANEDISAPILLIDSTLFLIFFGATGLIFFGKIRRVHPIVPVLISGLVMISFIQFGGVHGSTEYNIMAVAMLLVLILSRKSWIMPLTLYLSALIWVMLDFHFNGILRQTFFLKESSELDSFIFTIGAIVLFMIVFKAVIGFERRKMTAIQNQLNNQSIEIETQTEELKIQEKEYLQANQELEKEIELQTKNIRKQDEAIKNYIELSTSELMMPLEKIKTLSQTSQVSGQLGDLLKESTKELEHVLTQLKKELNESSID